MIVMKFSSIPPAYDKRIFKSLYQTMEMGLFVHLTMALWILGNETYFNIQYEGSRSTIRKDTALYYFDVLFAILFQVPRLWCLSIPWFVILFHLLLKYFHLFTFQLLLLFSFFCGFLS